MKNHCAIQSPLNYTGGKFRLLPQILPLLPKDIGTFVDLFCGGCNVGININCNMVIFNDINSKLINLLNTFKHQEKNKIISSIYKIIRDENLSLVSEHSYEFYKCNSSKGLAEYNKEQYLKLREKFNRATTYDFEYFITLYVLIIYAFNNQIRFNRKGEFNLPIGKRDFNNTIKNKLEKFIDKIHSTNCEFVSYDFDNFDIDHLTNQDFVYADPPYLICCAAYNENGGWTAQNEIALLSLLDELDKRQVRFALSNVLTNKGIDNIYIKKWLENNPHYKCNHLTFSYSNSNYQVKDRLSKTDEVLITNY